MVSSHEFQSSTLGPLLHIKMPTIIYDSSSVLHFRMCESSPSECYLHSSLLDFKDDMLTVHVSGLKDLSFLFFFYFDSDCKSMSRGRLTSTYQESNR